jgi:hypothetical protein
LSKFTHHALHHAVFFRDCKIHLCLLSRAGVILRVIIANPPTDGNTIYPVHPAIGYNPLCETLAGA